MCLKSFDESDSAFISGAALSVGAPAAAQVEAQAGEAPVPKAVHVYNAVALLEKTVPHGTEAAGRTARTLADRTATLERLHRLEIGAPRHNGQDSYDDLPADLDAFREALTQRIESFLASRTDADAFADIAGGPAGVAE